MADLASSDLSKDTSDFASLSNGSNDGVLFSAKLLARCSNSSVGSAPFNFLAVDSAGCFGIIALFDIGHADSVKFSSDLRLVTLVAADPTVSTFVPDFSSLVADPTLPADQASMVGKSDATHPSLGLRDAPVVIVKCFHRSKIRFNGMALEGSSASVLSSAGMKSDTFDA
jgi:hypothetical protein